jgi:hypothetical protein
MKMLNQKNSCLRMSADVTDAPDKAPRRKTLSLPKSVPVKTGHKPHQAAAFKRRRGRADRFALRWAEEEGLYLRAK